MEGFELIKVKSYYHQNPGTKPDYRPAYNYYRSLTDSVFNYKGVDVFCRKHLNEDGSDRGYEVVKTSLPYLRGVDLEVSNVRTAIDRRISDFQLALNDRPAFCEYSICSDGSLYSTAFSRSSSLKYNVLERRYILSDLINKGLPFAQALEFLPNIH
jgi:hypothetical protein